MKVIGWIMAIVAGLIILYNVKTSMENERQLDDHPWITIFSGGANLKESYTFRPPYTGFEITVITAGVIGVALIAFGPGSDNKH